MSMLSVIKTAIEDIHLMDGNNIAPIIESYCKYTIFEETDIECLLLEYQGENWDGRKAFISSNDGYYAIEDPIHGIEFKNGEPICKDECNHATNQMERLVSDPEKYIFIKTRYTTSMWRLIRKFPTYESYKDYGSRDLAKWVHIYKAPLLLNERWINIKLNDTYIFFGMNDDAEEVQFTPEIAKQVFDVFFT